MQPSSKNPEEAMGELVEISDHRLPELPGCADYSNLLTLYITNDLNAVDTEKLKQHLNIEACPLCRADLIFFSAIVVLGDPEQFALAARAKISLVPQTKSKPT